MVKEILTTKYFFLTPVQDLIDKVEDLMRSQAQGHNSDLAAALNHLLASGGKRIRTATTLLTGEMLGGERDRLVTLAAAVELLHTATLVHDDLIDGSILRRGIPTINSQWSPAATVLTGDFIFARAAKLAAETDSVDVMKLFSDTLATIVNGEITQLFHSRKLASRDDYYRRIHAKTASMFELATGAAALLSPVNKQIVRSIIRYGYEVGMAFQIVDDILDFTGEQETVGKPVASDLRQGLITLPALYYMEMHPEDPDLGSYMNGAHYDEQLLMRLVGSIRKSGAVERAMDEARMFVERGLNDLNKMPDTVERQALQDMAEFIISRHR